MIRPGGFLPVALLSAALVFFIAACGSARPDIYFLSDRDGDVDIYVRDGDTAKIGRITSSVARERNPSVSPDGRKIAYLSERDGLLDLLVVDSDGKNEQRVGGPPGARLSFAWAPNGRRMAYEGETPDGSDIYVTDLQDGTTIHVTREPGREELGGWSRDGQWLIYAVTEGNRQGITRKNPDGVNEIRVTERKDSRPRWSPDGTRIAFESRRDSTDTDIYVVDINGKKEVNATNQAGNDRDFDWSPVSRRVVFVSDRDGNPEIYVQTIGGKAASRLTNNHANETGPKWSPDGKRILFVSDADGDSDIYLMRPDGKEQERLTQNDSADTEASWER
ncbi:MAG: PD40 domain-containing protein [Chloroflexi bacterium]|nr:PD40 domain-containing protein [Chloroflexota bacterium]